MVERFNKKYSRGAALITALVVVAIATTLAAGVALGTQIHLRQVENLRDRAQAAAVEQGAISWAMEVIKRDDANVDHMAEEWATVLPPLPVEHGAARIVATDAQALFNLNNVWRQNAPSQADIAVFRRLLQALDLNPALVEAVVDWIDPDTEARPGGADDPTYMAQKPSYRAANQPISSVEELRLIQGFDTETVEKLAPYVVALPTPTDINVNTAPALILSALFNLPLAGAEQFVKSRDGRKSGLSKPDELEKLLPEGTSLPKKGFGFKTAYFKVHVISQFGRSARRMDALISRSGNKPVLLWKSQRLI